MKPIDGQSRLAACQFFITGTTGFLLPFLPLYAVAAGLTPSQYGIAAAAGTATCLVVQPLLGKLSDRLDARRPVMVGAAVVAGIAYAVLRFVPFAAPVLFALMLALGVNGFQYLNAVTGVLAARLGEATGQSGGRAYVGVRVWGSVGFIVIALLAGLFVRGGNLSSKPDRATLDGVFTYGPWLFAVVAVLSGLVSDRKTSPSHTLLVPGDEVNRGDQVSNRRRFLAAFLLYQVALYGASAYLPLYLSQLHANPRWLTATFAAGVVSEVLVMTQIGRWTDRHGRRPALLFSFLLLPLRLLLYIPATSALWVLCVQLLHGFNFGILGTIAVVFVNDTADTKNRGAAQAELAATLGLGNSIGPIVCGYLVEHRGLGTMFGAMSGIAVVAAVVFCAFVSESHPATAGDFAHRLPRFLREAWL